MRGVEKPAISPAFRARPTAQPSLRHILDSSHSPPLSEAWYAALLSSRLKPGRMLGKVINALPILLGRDRDGTAFALLDICPHRAIPLRYGSFDGREITCCYHGWRFATDGACTAIPSLIDDRATVGRLAVRHFPVQERYGAIWVYTGTRPDLAPDLPDLPDFAAGRPQLALTIRFPSSIDHAVIGLMDPSHGTFVHRSWLWRKHALEKEKSFAPSPWGFTMVRHPPSANARAYRLLGGGSRTTEIGFRLPGLRTELIEIGRHRLCNLTALTPIGPDETELTQISFWTNPWLSLAKPLLKLFALNFIGQDRAVVAKQRDGLAFGTPLMLLGDPDAQARWYFRLKNEYRRSLEEDRPFVNPVKERVLRWRS